MNVHAKFQQMFFGNTTNFGYRSIIINYVRGQIEPHWFPYNFPKINTEKSKVR